MPSTLAIMKTYYEGAERQRALSYWSIGSWGGSGICSLFGGQLRQLWVGDGFSSSHYRCRTFNVTHQRDA